MTIQSFIEKAKPHRYGVRNPQRVSYRGDYAEIVIISKGVARECRFSYSDDKLVSRYRWYMKDGYAVTSINRKRVKMHHLIMGARPVGMEVDHANRDRLDNRRENLRFLTRGHNAMNRGFGRNIRKKGAKWEAYIQVARKQKYLGMYDTPESARESYLKAKEVMHTV